MADTVGFSDSNIRSVAVLHAAKSPSIGAFLSRFSINGLPLSAIRTSWLFSYDRDVDRLACEVFCLQDYYRPGSVITDVTPLKQMNMQFSIARFMLLIAIVAVATSIYDNFGCAGIALTLVAVLSFITVCLIVKQIRDLPIIQTGMAAIAAILLGTFFHPFAGVVVFLLMIRLFVLPSANHHRMASSE